MRTRLSPARAFTLIELLVVVAIIALLIAILLPSLGRAREQTKSVKCLSNLKVLGQGIITYSVEEKDILPGPLHPAVYRYQGLDYLKDNPITGQSWSDATAREEQQRYLSFKLRRQFNDTSSREGSASDEVSTCPTMAAIAPDQLFYSSKAVDGKSVFPIHYAINNYYTADPNLGVNVPSVDPGSNQDQQRATNPMAYFGYSAPRPIDASKQAAMNVLRPQPLSKIKKPGEEWMVADAWWRTNPDPLFPEFQQAGPYQVNWTGARLPNFAPHFAKVRSYTPIDNNARDTEAAVNAKARNDGRTNTVFFDGHADSVQSRSLVLDAGGGEKFEILYGFKGTVNSWLNTAATQNLPLPYWE